MKNINWDQEQQRFMELAYERTIKAANRAFWGWHSRKKDDAIAECMAKAWDQWHRLVLRHRDPEPMLNAIIKYSILWVRDDRRIAGRASTPDVFDYRSGFTQQLLSAQGQASPSDRSNRNNPWITFRTDTGDNPADLAAALEATGLTLEQWLDK